MSAAAPLLLRHPRKDAVMATQTLFSTHLKDEAERSNIRNHHIANNCRVGVDDIRSWMSGESQPTRAEFQRLVKTLPRMRFFPPMFAKEVEEPVSEKPEVIEPKPLPESSPRPATFGAALRIERELEEIDREVLAELCEVTGQAVSAWEHDINNPVQENYDKLLALFPRLKDAPQPDCKDIPVPTSGKGNPRMTYNRTGVTQVTTPLIAPGTKLPTPKESAPASGPQALPPMQGSRPTNYLFDDMVNGLMTSMRLAGLSEGSVIQISVVGGVYQMTSGNYTGQGVLPSDAAVNLNTKFAEPILQRREELRKKLAEFDTLASALGVALPAK